MQTKWLPPAMRIAPRLNPVLDSIPVRRRHALLLDARREVPGEVLERAHRDRVPGDVDRPPVARARRRDHREQLLLEHELGVLPVPLEHVRGAHVLRALLRRARTRLALLTMRRSIRPFSSRKWATPPGHRRATSWPGTFLCAASKKAL